MKKLIKNEICGSMNSAYVHCSLQKVNICGYCSLNSNRSTPKRMKTKKKKKRNKMQLGNVDLESKHTLKLAWASVCSVLDQLMGGQTNVNPSSSFCIFIF